MPDTSIRLASDADRAHLEACWRELQDFEGTIDPNRVPSEPLASRYVSEMLKRCGERSGAVYVAERAGEVVGFVCVWVSPSLSGSISRVQQVGYIADLVVSRRVRGQGIGRALLERAERFAVEKGLAYVKVDVLAGNARAREMYRRAGFGDYEVAMLKSIGS